jgi:hypothetical protein
MLKTFKLIKLEEFISHIFLLTIVTNLMFNYNILVIAISFLMIIRINYISKKPISIIYISIGFLFAIILMFTVNITVSDIDQEKLSAFIKKIFFGYLIFIVTILYYYNKIALLMKSVELVLFIFLITWIIQFLVYYTTGYYIDYLEMMTGVNQRYAESYLMKIGIIRPSGLLAEPGTYAMTILPLLILDYLYKKQLTLFHKITIFSMYATLSIFAIVTASLFLFFVFIQNFKIKITFRNIIYFIIALIIIYFLFLGVEHYLSLRLVTNGNGGISQRENIIQYWLSSDAFNILYGQGYVQSKFLDYVISDSGLWFKFLFEYGLFSIPIFILMAYVASGFNLFFLFIVLITKLSYLTYLFWFFLAALYIQKINKYKEDYNENNICN